MAARSEVLPLRHERGRGAKRVISDSERVHDGGSSGGMRVAFSLRIGSQREGFES